MDTSMRCDDDLSSSAFLSSGWQEAVAVASTPDCWGYWPRLYELADNLANEGDDQRAASVRAVARACHLGLGSDDDDEPFVPIWQDVSSRSTALEDITDEELDFYAELLNRLDDPPLQARLGDILWCRRRDGAAARKAAEAYRAAAKVAIEAGRAARAQKEIRRTLDLAASLGRQNEAYQEAVAVLEDAVSALDSARNRNDAKFIVPALLHHRAGDIAAMGSVLEAWADDATNQQDWIWAQQWWHLAVRCAELRGDRHTIDRIRRRSADAFVLQGEAAVASGEAANAAHWLQAAVSTLQSVGGTQEERGNLTQRLRQFQEMAAKELHGLSHEVDLTEGVTEAIKRVKQPTLRRAIIEFARLFKPPSRDALDEETRSLIESAPLSMLIPSMTIDRRGRVTATSGPLSLGGEQDAAFRHRVIRIAAFHQQHAALVLDRVRRVIAEHHTITIDEIRFLTYCSPFVPPEREGSFAKGLYSGMRGDYVTAVHRLLPQLEHALRILLHRAGVETLTQDQDGVQKERNLASLLAMPALEQLLGDALIFDLQCLLVEPNGSNLRNDIAHGLRDDHDLDSWDAIYFWWSILRLCVLSAMSTAVPSPGREPDVQSDGVKDGSHSEAGAP